MDALYPSSAELSAGHSNSPTSTTELHAMLAETRKRGWAREIDSVTVGWSTLAVPVVDVSGYPLLRLPRRTERRLRAASSIRRSLAISSRLLERSSIDWVRAELPKLI
ncbi:transcriptional regulator [Cutibacterium acnes JCM 18918]|nr:transcriptional regulator [Cutibacterium acnes JCM 18918]